MRRQAVRRVREGQERIPAQAQTQGEAAADAEVVLHVGVVEITREVDVVRRHLGEGRRLAEDEVGEIVARILAGEIEAADGFEILVEQALLAQQVHAPEDLVAAVDPRPGMLQVVLIARHAVGVVVADVEVAGDQRADFRAVRQVGRVDAEALLSGKIGSELDIERAVEGQGGVVQQRGTRP